MEDNQWISVSKRTGKPGRKFGLTGRQHVISSQPKELTAVDESYQSNETNIHDEHVERTNSNLSEREIEEKFNVISLSIKTEALTLKHRLEHQHRQRDLAESNLAKEIHLLQSIITEMRQEVARGICNNYSKQCESSQFHELFTQVENQVEAVRNSALSISCVAETLGAVEYESRLSAAVELVILYVDTVKRKWEKEHRELEETKRILKESGVNVAQCLEAFRERNRPKSNASQTTKRRASFPASPLRRISMDNSSPSSTAPLRPGQCSLPMSKIAEERDEEEHVKSALAASSASALCHVAGTATATSGHNQVKSINSCQTPAVSGGTTSQVSTVTKSADKPAPLRRERRGPGKSKSWTSAGPADSLLINERNKANNRLQTPALVLLLLLWLKTLRAVGDWCRLQSDKYQRKVLKWRHYIKLTWQRKWEVGQLLLLARYAAAVCCLIAALVSLLITFVPTMAHSVSAAGFRPVRTDRIFSNSNGPATIID